MEYFTYVYLLISLPLMSFSMQLYPFSKIMTNILAYKQLDSYKMYLQGFPLDNVALFLKS